VIIKGLVSRCENVRTTEKYVPAGRLLTSTWWVILPASVPPFDTGGMFHVAE